MHIPLNRSKVESPFALSRHIALRTRTNIFADFSEASLCKIWGPWRHCRGGGWPAHRFPACGPLNTFIDLFVQLYYLSYHSNETMRWWLEPRWRSLLVFTMLRCYDERRYSPTYLLLIVTCKSASDVRSVIHHALKLELVNDPVLVRLLLHWSRPVANHFRVPDVIDEIDRQFAQILTLFFAVVRIQSPVIEIIFRPSIIVIVIVIVIVIII